MTEVLPREFFARPVLDVARDLLGCTVEHGGVAVRLTEVEAYAGTADPGSHAFRGPTPRTEVMFGPAGHAYVYLSYGMHHCMNLVTGPEGEASAVLLRAGEVVGGMPQARDRRTGGGARMVADRDLARGPARLTMALGIDRTLDGADVCAPSAPLVVRSPTEPVDPAVVLTGPRVGVSGAGGDGTAYPWRLWLAGDPTVSVYRAAVARRRRAGT